MFKKVSKTVNPKVCLRCPVMTSSKWLNTNIQLVCAESAVKFDIWDVVSVVLSLIIMSSAEIDSLGLFTVGFKTLQLAVLYYERLASNIRIANTACTVNHTFGHYAQYSAREFSLVP